MYWKAMVLKKLKSFHKRAGICAVWIIFFKKMRETGTTDRHLEGKPNMTTAAQHSSRALWFQLLFPSSGALVWFSWSKMARAGQRVDTSFSSYYYSFAKSGWEHRPGKLWEVVLGFPSFSLLVWVGRVLPWCVGPAGRWVCALVSKYLHPAVDRDRYGPQNPAYWVLKFQGTILMAWLRTGSQVTWRLAVQFKMC